MALAAKETPNFSMEQELAISMGADKQLRIVGITGGAGTGKTLVLGQMYKELRRQFRADQIAVCAPTGRAAKRVQELTGIKATTIHKLLEYPTPEDYNVAEGENPPENKPKRRREYPLVQRIVIVDEASMLGPSLYAHLMEALPPNGCIRFIGDNNQLPPVEDGDPPFINILERDEGNVTLTFNFRSDDYIVHNAIRILEGKIPQQNERFRIIYSDNPIIDVTRMASKHFMHADHQIIIPNRKGNWGTNRVNPSLQLKFNGDGPSLRLDRHDDKEPLLTVRKGDKFLWTKNDYALNMFNGEIGSITSVDTEDGNIELLTPERQILVPPYLKTYSPYHGHAIQYDPRKHIELGYAITTHKSQGSEFKTVIYCICRGQAFNLSRQNLYTAVTRAKHQVIIICDRRAMGLSMIKMKPR